MCNCITELEQSSLELIRQRVTSGDVLSAIMRNKQTDHSGILITYSEMAFTIVRLKPRRGESPEHTRTSKIIHKYCPFCGEQYKPD